MVGHDQANQRANQRGSDKAIPASGDARTELAELMHRMADRMRRRFHEAVIGHGLTLPMFAALREVAEPIPMGAAAERLACDASYVTGLADRLEGLGLIERRQDPSDRRVKQLVITPAGADLRERIQAEISGGDGLLSGLDDADVADLIRIYRKMLGEQG